MTSQAKHTPWIVEPINDGQSYQITTAETSGFRVIAETDSKEIADRIVHLESSHDALVDACINASNSLNHYAEQNANVLHVQNLIDIALRLAKGEADA